MRSIAILLAAVTAASAAHARPSPAFQQRAEARLAKALEGRVAGKPVDCINFRDIRSTEIIDRTAILYRTGGNRLYVNRPDIGRESLNSDDILLTKTSLSQLCNVDTVQLIDRGSRFMRGFVGLGQFVPYTKATPKG